MATVAKATPVVGICFWLNATNQNSVFDDNRQLSLEPRISEESHG